MKPGEERAATMADARCFARPGEGGTWLAVALESIGTLDPGPSRSGTLLFIGSATARFRSDVCVCDCLCPSPRIYVGLEDRHTAWAHLLVRTNVVEKTSTFLSY